MTLDDLVDPKFHSLVTVARRLSKPDEGDEAAVRAWQPTAQFRAAVRLVATATLAHYVGVVEALADEADRDDDGVGETLH